MLYVLLIFIVVSAGALAMVRASKVVKIVGALVIALLSLIGYGAWVWTNTKIVDSPSSSLAANAPGTLVPDLRIDKAGGAGFVAQFSLTNAGTERIDVLETRALDPLYEVSMKYRPAAGAAWQNVFPTRARINEQIAAARPGYQSAFDRQQDAIVPLLPGRSLVRPIKLSSLFEINLPGEYEVFVKYQPEALARAMGKAEFDELNVYSKLVQVSSVFETGVAKNASPPKTLPEKTPERPGSAVPAGSSRPPEKTPGKGP